MDHDPGSPRVENRLPGADTSPYLTTAATLAAGVAGIPNPINPEPELIGSGYSREPVHDFARSMQAAIGHVRSSAFARDWLGSRFVDGFTATREAQHDECRKNAPDVDLQRFFDLG